MMSFREEEILIKIHKKEVKPTGTKEALNSTKFNQVLIIMIVILLLLTLALFLTTFSQLTSEQSKLTSWLDKNEDTNSELNMHRKGYVLYSVS